MREHIDKNICQKKKEMKRDSLRGTKIRNDTSTTGTLFLFDDVYKIRGTGCVLSVKAKSQTKISDNVMSQLVKVEDNDSNDLGKDS